jgi:urease gamma subunit
MNDAISLTELELAMRKLANTVKLDTIEACAKIADAARESAKEHHGVEASIGADIAARRIRALAVPSQSRGTP